MATAAANIYEQDPRRVSEHAAWSAVVNIQPGSTVSDPLECALLAMLEEKLRALQLNNGIEGGNGSPHQ